MHNSDLENIRPLRAALLEWFAANRRDLPWRQTHDPYAIWVSEVMLQQTRVAAVQDRYTAFLRRFPTVAELAQAPEQEVLAQWSGLGYYRRARMLHQATQRIEDEGGGRLPVLAAEWRLLPGIGAYTAAAIASIAHDEPVAVVDGNVERVLCRLRGWHATESAVRRRIEGLAAVLVDPERPGQFNQALMELGALVCTPRTPNCTACPWIDSCATRGEHKTAPRPPVKIREVAYGLLLRKPEQKGREVLLVQRSAAESVMPGMWELPALADPQVEAEALLLTARHAIMNTRYLARVRALAEPAAEALLPSGCDRRWVPLDEAGRMALTGLARKVLRRLRLIPAAR